VAEGRGKRGRGVEGWGYRESDVYQLYIVRGRPLKRREKERKGREETPAHHFFLPFPIKRQGGRKQRKKEEDDEPTSFLLLP